MLNRNYTALLLIASALLLAGCDEDDKIDLDDYIAANSIELSLNSTMPAHMEDTADIDEPIYIFFDTAVAPATSADSFQLKRLDNDSLVETQMDIRGATVILKPVQGLDYSTEYYLENNGVVENTMGNELDEDIFIKFTTEDIYIPVTESTYSPADGEGIAPGGEIYLPVTEERAAMHADAEHGYYPVVTATLPALFDAPTMDSVEDYIVHRDEMVAINPAPNEYLWVMEGQRHGFENLTVVLTHTIPGNGAPLHAHVGEEAHVLLQGTMYYQLGDEKITVQAPYILNIPPMVPHGFINVGKETANIVGVFPEANHWEYDVFDYDIFSDFFQSQSAQPMENDPVAWLQNWHSEENRQARLNAYTKDTK
ncbi:cupin domain-containing protein [Teredinibacter waterburyi]|jgi:Uncharacterized conserved protein, contains double-stranded beta-helix domain|uniref:cupin domain-containing protein n=1 Tax=Teredinibacter waterburyi TaxID=1500538 RepID=UPI00165F052A|nr:cupin domain-containing protein [Teredinibacter waterburyi]